MKDNQVNLRHYDIIRNPVLTEKSNMLTEHNQFVFDVSMDATKPEIKAAIQSIFGVEVVSENTLVRKGKQKVFRGRRGVQKDFKRAMVRIKSDQRIDVASGV